MTARPMDFLLRHLRTLVGAPGAGPQTDRQLLERFAAGGEADLAKDSWVSDARLADATPITVIASSFGQLDQETLETERFLFYDGLVPAPDHVRCIKVTDGAITVKNTAAFAIGPLFLVDRRPGRQDKGWAMGQRVTIPPGSEIEIPTEAAKGGQDLEQLHHSVRKALVDAGLFAAEADSMMKIWRKELLEASGVTVFHVLPQAEYNRMLPLDVNPRPANAPVRVGIAYHPHFEMGPQVREKVAQLIRDLDSGEFKVREAAMRQLKELGPWAGPQVREALALKPNLDKTVRLEQVLESTDASEWIRDLPKKKGK